MTGAPRLRAQGLRVAGVMTGTSCDGLDIACVEFDGPSDRLAWRPLWSGSAAYPAALRRRVLDAQAPGTRRDLRDWLTLHRDLGRWYAQAIGRVLHRQNSRARPHLLANHGQTLAHHPEHGLTLQMGDPSILAHETGLSVACSFREGDLAARGQGAPLVPRFHALLARGLGRPGEALAIHNLGGISNLSYFQNLPDSRAVLAFDTGPANLWIDAAAALATRGRQRLDRDGKLARAGQVDQAAVRAILKLPYFARPAPKSTGRDQFPFELLLSHTRAKGADLVATATAVTVESIALSYENAILRKRRPLDRIHFCGGGAKNPTLLQGIRERLPEVIIGSIADAGLDPQLVEAQAFAYYGCLALLGQPIGGPWTGARGYGPPGHVIPGANWTQLAATLRATRSRR